MVLNIKGIPITASDGRLLEKGDAVHDVQTDLWKYAATVANRSLTGSKVQAIAFDRPGNETSLVKVL